MIHAIVFAARGGYQFFERTPDFPQAYLQDIDGICSCLSIHSKQAPIALRYVPLDHHGLLTVIFRVPLGNADEKRGHVMAVNFLMDERDTQKFFDLAFFVSAGI